MTSTGFEKMVIALIVFCAAIAVLDATTHGITALQHLLHAKIDDAVTNLLTPTAPTTGK